MTLGLAGRIFYSNDHAFILRRAGGCPLPSAASIVNCSIRKCLKIDQTRKKIIMFENLKRPIIVLRKGTTDKNTNVDHKTAKSHLPEDAIEFGASVD